MYCTACGSKNALDSNFCRACGHKLERPALKITEADFERAMPDEEQVSALLERAYTLRKKHDLEGAIVLCRQALALHPDSTDAHSLLAQLHELGGDLPQAIAEYARVLELNPGSIADRVKLDELRNEISGQDQATSRKHPATRIVLTEPPAAAGRSLVDTRTLAIAGGAIGLTLLGGIFTLLLRVRSNETAHATPVANAAGTGNGVHSNGPVAPSTTGAQTDTAAVGSQLVSPGVNMPAPAAPTGSEVNPGIAAGFGMPPVTIVQNPTPRIIRQTTPVYVPVPASTPRTTGRGALPGVAPVPAPARGTSELGGTNADSSQDNRVMLPPDGDATDDGKGHIAISVSSDKPATKPDRIAKNRAIEDSNPGSIKVEVKRGNRANEGQSPNSDARSLIAMGNEHKKRGDYDGAVRAYRQAVSNAGDATGLVYQQIAYCFQQKGDRASAVTNYERAIDEYRRLLAQGRQTDTARDGIRGCQSGIKTCNLN